MLGSILRILVTTSLAIAMVAAAAGAQTQPAAPAPTPSPNQGAVDELSPGNQKIARALFDAQKPDATTQPLTLDAITSMKQNGKGWGQVFKDMKAQGLLQEKNLGQVVSRASRQQHAVATPIPSGSSSHVGTGAAGEPRVRARGVTLQDAEQTLFDQQRGLARGDTAFDARFENLALTRADQQRLLEDIQNLNQMPEGSRVRLRGAIDGQRFRADVRNHKGELEVKLKGVQFGSQEEAKAFVNSLRQGGADRVRVKGLIAGQRVDARFRDHNGRVEQRFRLKEPDHGTEITTASGRSHVAGAKPKPDTVTNSRGFGDDHGKKLGNDHRFRLTGDHGRKSFDRSGLSSSSGRSGGSGHGGRGKD